MPKLPLIVTAVVCLVAGLALGWLRLRHEQQLSPTTTVSEPLDFTLTDHTGKVVHLADFRGKPVLCYFGYTFCPDVCPTELGYQARLLKALGPAGDNLQPLFISVDRQRDTPAVLAGYVPMFHPRLIGLTGDTDQLSAAAKAFHVRFDRVEVAGNKPGFYLMNHSSATFVLDKEGRHRATIDSHDPLDEALAKIRAVL